MPVRFSLPKPKKNWRYYVPEGDVAEYTESGFSPSPHRRRGQCLVTKRKPEWERFEDEVLILFRDGLKLSDVNGGPAFKIGEYQIDVAGGIEDTLLVVECKSKREIGQKSLRSVLRDFWVKRRSVAAGLRKRFKGRYKRTIFVMALRKITPSKKDLRYAKKKRIVVWSESYFESIRSLYLAIGERARYYVLRELGGKPPLVPGGKGRHFVLPALEARSGSGRIYCLFVPARILLDVAYVLRIESGQKRAYQRFLDKNRLLKIARFLEDGRSFKNSILLALDTKTKFSAKKVRWGNVTPFGFRIGLLRLPRQYASAWVIDGQHRLYGFARAERDLSETPLPVVALQMQSKIEEAETFVDINKNQKPVDPNLLWALFGKLYPHETRGVISDLVRQLATERKSILRNRIYVPGESKHSRREYSIFHSNLCETIGDHLVAGKSKGSPLVPADTLYEPLRSKVLASALSVISSYLDLLVQIAERAGARGWIRGFFFTNNGLNVMIRVLVHILKYYDGKFDKREVKQAFQEPLGEYLASRQDDIDQLRRQTSSEGTRESAAYGFIKALARQVPGFAEPYLRAHERDRENQEPYRLMRNVEEALRESISDALKALTDAWWRERIPPDVREEANRRKMQDESPWPWMERKQYAAYFYMSFADYSKVILRRDNWREAFEPVFGQASWVDVVFRELEKIRNTIAHNRDLSERELNVLRLYSSDLQRVLSGAKSKLEIDVPFEVGVPLAVEAQPTT
ncbi:MAG: DGQHR domain-containing protein [Candidatus Acidiferrales bacterium]